MKRKMLAFVLCMLLAIQPVLTVKAENSTQSSGMVGLNEEAVNDATDIEENNKDSESNEKVEDENNEAAESNEKVESENNENSSTISVENIGEGISEQSETIEDTEDPVLDPDTLTIDKTDANVGDIIKFSVKVSDNVKLDRVVIRWENLDNNNEITWKNMVYNKNIDKYEYSLKVAETMVAGHWIVGSIGAYDTSGNYSFINNHYGDNAGVWDFYITNDSIDSEPPIIEVSSLEISKHEVKVGESIVISVKVTDNIRLKRVSIGIRKGTEFLTNSYDMSYNKSTGLYEYIFKPDSSYIGRYRITSILAYDTMENKNIKVFNEYDDATWLIVSENDEGLNYDCEVINLKCNSGENSEYSYSYDKYDNVYMRILDKSIVGYVQQGTSVSNTTREISGVFTPYKEGKTTVEVFSTKSDTVLKVYKIEVTPKKYSTCIKKSVSGTFLSSTKQNYSVMCNNKRMDTEIKLLRYTEITTGGSTTGQYEYGYELNFGEIGNKHVSIIGETDKKERVLDIEVLEHDFLTEWTVDKEAACNEAGSKSHHCVRCDEKADITEIPKIEHEYSTEWTIDKEPTCTEAGSRSHHCIKCGEKKDVQELTELGHQYGEWHLIQFPTYESEGIENRTCGRCNGVEKRMLPKLEIIIPKAPHVQVNSLDSNNIELSWNNISPSVWYEIYRASEFSGEYEFLLVASDSTEIITHSMSAPTGIPYYYKVRAAGYQNGELVYGEFSNIEEGKAELSKLSGLKATPSGARRVSLSWDEAAGAKGYLIYAQKNGKYGYVGMTTRGATYTDVNTLDTDYNFYWVFPYVEDTKGKIYPGKCEKYVYAKGVCPAVTNLKAESQKDGVKLSWAKSAGAEGYLIYGKTESGNYGYISMTTTGTTYIHKNASKEEYNFYWVFPYHKDSNEKMVVGGTPKYVYGKAK